VARDQESGVLDTSHAASRVIQHDEIAKQALPDPGLCQLEALSFWQVVGMVDLLEIFQKFCIVVHIVDNV